MVAQMDICFVFFFYGGQQNKALYITMSPKTINGIPLDTAVRHREEALFIFVLFLRTFVSALHILSVHSCTHAICWYTRTFLGGVPYGVLRRRLLTTFIGLSFTAQKQSQDLSLPPPVPIFVF